MEKGRSRQRQCRNSSDREVSDELARATERRPMLVGALLAGFGGDWITQGSCLVCGSPHDTMRCSQCQCGFCEDRGALIVRAGQMVDSSEWQSLSFACCSSFHECEERQRQIAEFWKQQTGEEVQ